MQKKLDVFIKNNRILLLALALGLILMLLPNGCQKSEDKKPSQNAVNFSLDEFQKKLESILASGEGVGRVRVMLTQKSTETYVYAEETRSTEREQQNGEYADQNFDYDRKPSIISDGSGKQVPVTVKQLFPEFMGAVVVCDGAESISVQTFVTETVSALTGISFDRIAIVKMKQ